LADESEDDVGQALAVLMDSHCLEDDGQHRYRMHDLVRIYAAELAAKHGSPGQNLSAMRRLLEWYRQRVVVSGLWHGSEYGPPGADLMQAFSSGPEALAWCEAERASLVAATRRAAELGMPGVAAQIAAGLGWFFQRMPYLGEWQATH